MRIQPKTLLLLVSPPLLLVAIAYLQWGIVGLPALPPVPAMTPAAAVTYGFPAWLRITHFVNLLFLILLIRSGLQILMDHPRLYWNVHCTPGTEWLRVTPVTVPTDRFWTSNMYHIVMGNDTTHLIGLYLGLAGIGVVVVQYYDSLSMENARNPQTLLACEMNDLPLSHSHGRRCGCESRIKGEGGYAEDHEYFGELANI